MKSKSLKIAVTFGVFFVSLFIPAKFSLAFDDLTTHPAITDEIVDFHNLYSGNKITPEEKELIISGAMGEDIPPRWINHFYDPIRNIGWTGRNTGVWPTSLVRYFSGTVLSSAYPVSSLNWLHNQELQTYYKMYKGNRTWERAVYEYANGNRQEALYTLGYILHLIEDAAVPDHTRDDPHAHDMRLATGDYGSPLEEYAKRYDRNNFNIADELKNNGYKPIALSGVDDYLVSLAKYSNGYFFSKDTINDPVYQNPKITEEDGKFGYGLDKNGEKFNLVRVTKRKIRVGDEFKEITDYFLLENKGEEMVINDYFTRLSREAIIHGAGVIDLFFKETEAIILGQKQAPKLFAEEPKSVVQRVVALDVGLGNISATGEFFKVVNLIARAYNNTKEAVFGIAASVVNLFSQKSNDELSAAFETINLNNSENNTDSNSSASNTSSKVSYEIYQENITPIDDSQPATLAVTNLKLAEESIQILRNQLLALQAPPSRLRLDGGASSLSSSMSSFAPTETSQPKLIASIYPGFGGGGDGGGAISSASGSSSSEAEASSSSISSAEEVSSFSSENSSSSESSSLPAEEAGSSSSADSFSSASESSSSSSNSSISDTDPPTISSFSVVECQQSLSSDGCLVATTTLNIAWNSLSADLDYFTINNNGAVSTTTSSSTVVIVSDNAVFSFAVSAKDLAGNFSATSTQTVEISTMPVVINEVAWAGNGAAYSSDEWIELYNRTNKTINLTDWTLYSKTNLTPYVNLSGQIISKDHYLLERTDDDTVSNLTADKIYTGDLVNNGENLALVYKPAGQATTTIDEIPYDTNWYAGSSFNYSTMERYDADIAGTDSSNWGTNNLIIKNGKNAGGGNINGTPKVRNSANYLINKGQNVSSNLTLYASNSPYLVNNSVQTFSASSTLAIEPGVVIKFYNDAGLSFNNGARISAAGSSANPIIFTSFYDDTYAGDTNSDATSTAPSAGNWYGVRINSPGAESAISNAIFRYGGKYYNGPWSDSRANLYIANSSAAISDSIFEYSKVYGLKMVNSYSSIADSIFRNNNNIADTAGYDSSLLAIGGSPSLSRSSFASNRRGAYFFNSPATVDSNTFTSNTGEAIYSYGQLGSYANNSGSGNGVDAISLSGTIAQNGAIATLSANALPYLLRGNVIVAASSTLAVNPNIAIKGWNTVSTSYLNVYGNLIVSGANFSDIIFGSMYSSPAKGNWGGVRLYSGSQSTISGATFEYADTAIAYIGSPLNLSNVKFNENNLGVSADVASRAYPISVSNITFTDNTATTSPGGLW